MLERVTHREACWVCFSSLAYLAGYCPVCMGTGFVEVEVKVPEPSSWFKGDFDPELPIERL